MRLSLLGDSVGAGFGVSDRTVSRTAVAARLRRWSPGLLLAGAAALYLIGLGRVGLFDPAEGTYAEVAREMAALRDWVTPRFDFVRYFEKPPLLYWLNALSFKLFGLSEFSARLPTALAAVAGVGCVYGIGRDFWGRRAGLVSGAVLATSFGYFIFGRMVLPDMLCSVLIAAALWGFGRALVGREEDRAAALGAHAAMAGAVLAKGLIGIVFPFLTVGLFLALAGEWSLWRRLEPVRGLALFLAVTVPWHVLVAWRNPGFLWFYFVNEHLYRFLGRRVPLDYANLPIGIYLAMTAVWFCPWSVFLPAAIRRCWPRSRREPAQRGQLFVLCWAAVVIAFFVVSSSRLEYYALPALPALALCVGRFWDVEIGEAQRGSRSGRLTPTWIALIAFALCLVPAAYLFPRLQHVNFYNMFTDPPGDPARDGALAAAKIDLVPSFGQLVPLFEAVVGVIVAGTAVSAYAWVRRGPRLALACLVGSMLIGLVSIEKGFALFAPNRSIARLGRLLRTELRPGDQVLIEGGYEKYASLDFYTGRRTRVYGGPGGDLQFGSRYPEARGTFVSEGELARLWRGPARVYLLSDDPDCLSRLRALASGTVVLGRTGDNWLYANGPGPD